VVVGAGSPAGTTVTPTTADEDAPARSVTVSSNWSSSVSAATVGAVKVGAEDPVEESDTGGPNRWAQRYVSASPASGSVEYEPSSRTTAPLTTVIASRTREIGGRFPVPPPPPAPAPPPPLEQDTATSREARNNPARGLAMTSPRCSAALAS
jgi:hypothetical protein